MIDYKTTIKISKESKMRLKELALTPTESYEHIILRLLDVKLGGRELDYLISDKHSDHSLKVKVDWGKSEENILFYDHRGELHFSIPELGFDDDWVKFQEYVSGLSNLINILAVLEYDESIDAGEVVLKRVS